MNGRGRGDRDGRRDGGREYASGGGPHNVNEMNTNNSGGHDEGQKVGQGQRERHGVGHSEDKGGRNGTRFCRGAYH